MLACWNCGRDLSDVPLPISRHAQCDACFEALHSCRMCKHFDASATTTCFEDRADVPIQKEVANFCEFFSPSSSAFDGTNRNKAGKAKSELDALFAGPDGDDAEGSPENEDTSAEQSSSDKAKQALDDLFK